MTTALGGIMPCADVGIFACGQSEASAHETQHKKSTVADVALTSYANRRDWQKFREFYLDPELSGSLMGSAARRPVGRPACTGPIKYTGHAALKADIDHLKKAMAAAGVEEGFMCSIGPGSFARPVHLYYKTEEEFLFTAADAITMNTRPPSTLDPPAIPRSESPRQLGPDQPRAAAARIQEIRRGAHGALNHALRGLPADPSASISAGEAGTARTPPTSRSRTSSTWCSAQCRRLFGGGRQCLPRTRMAHVGGLEIAGREAPIPASSATPPTSSSIRKWWRTGSALRQNRWPQTDSGHHCGS